MTAAVLFLDAWGFPLRVASWQKAMTDIMRGKVEVVYYSADRTIQGVERRHPMPSIVRVINTFKRDRVRIKFSRLNIYARDGFRCQYCKEKFGTQELTFDHVLPRSKGGETSWTNIVTCCVACNKDKRDRTPEGAGMRLARVPKKPKRLPTISVKMGKDTPPEWLPYWNVDLSG